MCAEAVPLVAEYVYVSTVCPFVVHQVGLDSSIHGGRGDKMRHVTLSFSSDLYCLSLCAICVCKIIDMKLTQYMPLCYLRTSLYAFRLGIEDIVQKSRPIARIHLSETFGFSKICSTLAGCDR